MESRSWLSGSLTLALLLSVLWTLAEAAPPQSKATPPKLVLSIQGDRLSVNAQHVPLRTILAELARQVPLTVTLKGPVAGQPVSVTFSNVPLEEGIARLLAGTPHALLYGRTPTTPGAPGKHQNRKRIVEIVLLPRADAPADPAPAAPPTAERARPSPEDARIPLAPRPRQSEPPHAAPPTPEPEVETLKHQARNAPDAEDRVAALEALSQELEVAQALPLLVGALGDPDATVRAAALDLLKDTGEPVPLAPVTQIALGDANPELRMQALSLLAERAEERAGPPLLRALKDPDPEVREVARGLLEDLGLAAAGLAPKP